MQRRMQKVNKTEITFIGEMHSSPLHSGTLEKLIASFSFTWDKSERPCLSNLRHVPVNPTQFQLEQAKTLQSLEGM